MFTRARRKRIAPGVQISNTGRISCAVFVPDFLPGKLTGINQPVDGAGRHDQEFRRLLRGYRLFRNH